MNSRIIPASAGSTPVFSPTTQGSGSSPRARGARRRSPAPSSRGGIIPASAGSTGSGGTCRARHRDHPRERGEHPPPLATSLPIFGSSPRARGARVRAAVLDLPAGIIPASAGSTSVSSSRRRSTRDHPRERGEHQAMLDGLLALGGSSPRARGARLTPPEDPRGQGIIPASAGSTTPQRPDPRPSTDHPRERGEHPNTCALPDTHAGSSPRARGARLTALVLVVAARIIPASAGSTGPNIISRPRTGDHPRERGEH